VAEVSALPPGAHRFELQSLDLSGTPGPVTAVGVRVDPRWHERMPVRVLGGLIVVGLGVGLGGWRSRTVLRQNRRLRREVQRRVEIEAALQRQEAHYRGLFETEAVALLVLDAEGRCVDANPRARELLGQEPLGRDRRALGLPAEPVGAPRALRLPVAGDTALPVQVRETALGPEGAGGTVVVLTDLRDREEAELEQARLRAELSAARRLDALGRLAGGVAHDLNNVLAAIAGSVELAGMAPEAGPEALREIDDAVRRGSGMVDRLLAFGRPGGEPAERVDPDEVADGMRRLLERLLPPGVRLQLELGAPGHVRMSRCGLEQALLNLVTNAADALPDGGTITLRTRAVDGRVQIEVDDDGEGVDPALADRIFEPFVTSRPPGQGTGLGLATVRSVAVGAGGQALQLPRPGPGACFALRLPLAGPEAPAPPPPAALPAPPAPVSAPRPPSAGPRVLLVDDDDAVRRSLARPLLRAGFDVHDVASGEAALAWLRGGGDPEVLITDLGMGGMDGLQLAAAARALRPALPVLYISGGAAELRGAAVHGATLLKPFTPRELQDRLRQMIDDARPSPEAG
jgi:signal transduction histidine kinase